VHWYALLKGFHVSVVVISVSFFTLRVILTLGDIDWRSRWPWLKIFPHINDTLLLASGITLAVLLHLSPLAHLWLMAKLILLLAYIGLGQVALTPRRHKSMTVVMGITALLTVAAMIALVVLKPAL